MTRDESNGSCSTQRYRALILILAVYTAAVVPVAIYYGRFPGDLGMAATSFSLTFLFVTMSLLVLLLRAVRSDRERPIAAVAAWWRQWWREHGPGTIIASFILPALMTTFFMGKLIIPQLQPFAWDSRLAEVDFLLHGSSPWELIQPFLGIPAVTNAISLIYLFWFMLMFGIWVFWAMTDHPQRMRFLISYMLCWILLGTLLATLLSSAGPVFYAEITGDNGLFREQMAYLRAVDEHSPLISLRIRDRLWHAYATGDISAGSGISAMPSLHVAIVTLYAISGWYVNRCIGIAMTLYAVLIFIGSVHLGWHYAVDGYVSIVLVAAIWYFVGKVLDRRHSQNLNLDDAWQPVGSP